MIFVLCTSCFDFASLDKLSNLKVFRCNLVCKLKTKIVFPQVKNTF